MKLDNRVKCVLHICFVVLVYTALFELAFIGGADSLEQDPAVNLLTAISGVPAAEMFTEDKQMIIKWITAASLLFILAGREVYERLNQLKYMAVHRYGSYRKFYYSLMNRTTVCAVLYGGVGILITYALYFLHGNGEVGNLPFLKMGMIYLANILLLCLLQTLCMILTQGYTAGIVLLVAWFLVIFCGHWLLETKWIFLPSEWGMYLRSAEQIQGGVPDIAYLIQGCICALIWLVSPVILSKRKKIG